MIKKLFKFSKNIPQVNLFSNFFFKFVHLCYASEDSALAVTISAIHVLHRASYNFMSASSSHPTLRTSFGKRLRLKTAVNNSCSPTSYCRAASFTDNVPACKKSSQYNVEKKFIRFIKLFTF